MTEDHPQTCSQYTDFVQKFNPLKRYTIYKIVNN